MLLVSSGGLGDTVLFALVLPRFLGLARPGEEVTLLLRRDAAKMAFLVPPAVRVDTVDFARLRRDRAYRAETRRRLFDAHLRLVVSTDYLRHPDLDESLIRACRASESVAMEPRPWPKHDAALRRNRALYDRLFDSGAPKRDKVVRWTDFANWITGRDDRPPTVRLAADALPPPAPGAAPTVVMQPFSAVRQKQSPAELFRRMIGAVPDGVRVLVTGAPGDLGANPEFRSLLDLPGVAFDPSSFEDLVPTLRTARLVVSVDTALMHLAVAVGAPTVCLASAAFVGEIVPYAPEIAPDNVHVVYRSMPCEGCLGACILPAEDGMYPCVARLDGDAAVDLVRRLAADGGGGRA